MARWLASDGTLAQQASKASVTVDSVNHDILRAVVSDNGVWRQFWPATTPSHDPQISWGTDDITVIETVTDPLDSIASIVFDRLLGTYTSKNFPNADNVGLYLNPPATATGQYLIRVDQVLGDALTGTLGSWIDVYSLAEHTWSLDETVVGDLAAIANISVSQDNGGGSPVAATTVVKAVMFTSEVREGSKLVWSTDPYDLVEIREGEDADCILTFTPSGYAIGDAFTSGSFTENWHKDAPDLSTAGIITRGGELIVDYEGTLIVTSFNPADYTVNVTLVSGTAPTGSALGVDLTLDEVREWTLLAESGEDFSCALDVTVSDGTTSTTKRITKHSQRTEIATTSVWSDDPAWNLNDVWDTGPGPAGVSILVGDDGIVTTSSYNFPGGESENWHSEAPTPSDPENYECRLDVQTGDSSLITGTVGAWLNLASARGWNVESTIDDFVRLKTTLSIRRIGELTVAKTVQIRLSIEQ